jgi:transposase
MPCSRHRSATANPPSACFSTDMICGSVNLLFFIRISSFTIPRKFYFQIPSKIGGITQGLGRSKGGFTTKIHLRVNALGLPIGFALKGGEVSDFKGYGPLMEQEGSPAKVLLADKGYDADLIRQDTEQRGSIAMIPTRRNRKEQISVDPAIYVMRNIIERCFNKLKNARRLAKRYDKTALSYAAFVSVYSIRLWFRHFVCA